MNSRSYLLLPMLAVAACYKEEPPVAPTTRMPIEARGANFTNPGKVGAVTASFIQMDDAARDRLIVMLNQAGITWVRELMNWHQIQPVSLHEWNNDLKDHYHRTFQALRAAGIGIYVTLQGTPTYGCSSYSWCDTQQAPDLAKWSAFVSDAMTEFWEVDYWGVYNEPEVTHMWHAASNAPYYGNHYEAYKQTVHAAATVLHHHQRPEGGGWTKKVVAYENGEGPWLVPLASQIGNDIDVFAIHIYGYSFNGLPGLDRVDGKLRSVRPQGWPIWVGELGAPQGDPDDGQQSRQLVLMYQAQDQNGIANWQKTFLFHFWEPQAVNNLGIVRNHDSANPQPRLAYSCLQQLSRNQTLDPSCTATSECSIADLGYSRRPGGVAACNLYLQYSASIIGTPCNFSVSTNFPVATYRWYRNATRMLGEVIGTGPTLRFRNTEMYNLILVLEDNVGRRIAAYRDSVLPPASAGCLTPNPFYLAQDPGPGYMQWQSNVHGSVQFRHVYWQDNVYLGGVQYFNAIGMHAPYSGVGAAEFAIPLGATTFTSKFGFARQDISFGGGDANGRVYVDDNLVWSAHIVGGTYNGQVLDVSINIPPHATRLRLEVDNGSDGTHSGDQTTWGDPAFRGPGAT